MPTQASSFTSFPLLPPEIRLKIWQHVAIGQPPRIVELKMDLGFGALSTETTGSLYPLEQQLSSIPAAIQVNEEARDQILRYYTSIDFTRMHTVSSNIFGCYRIWTDIIFVNEPAPSKMRRLRPADMATYPLECLVSGVVSSTNTRKLQEICHLAIPLDTQDLLAASVARFARLLMMFSALKQLILVVPTFQPMHMVDQFRSDDYESRNGQRHFLCPWQVSPDRKESLEIIAARIKKFELELKEFGGEQWLCPEIIFKYATRATKIGT